jgi:hypothetical protein
MNETLEGMKQDAPFKPAERPASYLDPHDSEQS